MASLRVDPVPAPLALGNIRTVTAGLVLLAAALTIAGAWGFELIGHYVPCKLCLAERIPYYAAIPLAVAALVASRLGQADLVARLLLLTLAALFAFSVYQGVYHAGVEWGWWLGPNDCGVGAGPGARDAGGLLDEIRRNDVHYPSCTEATWWFPNAAWGLSFAGWNAAISAGIVLVALVGAAARRRG